MKIVHLLVAASLLLTGCSNDAFQAYKYVLIAAPSNTTVQRIRGMDFVSFLVIGSNKTIVVSDIDNGSSVRVQVLGPGINTIDPPIDFIERQKIGEFLHKEFALPEKE